MGYSPRLQPHDHRLPALSSPKAKLTPHLRGFRCALYPPKHTSSLPLTSLDNNVLFRGHQKAFITKAVRCEGKEISMAGPLRFTIQLITEIKCHFIGAFSLSRFLSVEDSSQQE